MLINTLFLSKPLTETDYSATTGSSEKLFGFLFSEIMNVNNEAEKLSLIPDHIGGNLIDYKSVFINYNFESNVILSNPQSKDTKDPIVSLSKLFIENEIIDNQKINEPEKVIYSPQQFVDSFTQLIKLLLDNNSDASKVELKLFSRNFILSQNIDHSNLQNVQEYLVKTIENEPLFSLSLSAFNRQIVFEVFSQVVPSIINKEVTLTQNVNVDNVDENLVKINSLNSIQSKINNNTKNFSEIVNTEIQEKTTDNNETRTLSVENDDVIVDKTEVKLSYLSSQNYETKGQLSAEKTIPNLSPNILKKSADNIIENTFVKSHSVAKDTNQETEKNNQTNLENRTSSENIAAKSNNIISVQSSKAENKTYQSEPKNFNELKEINTQQNKSINSTLKNEVPNVNNSGNTQIKIIIQNNNQNYDKLNSKESNVGLSKISTIIENTLEQSPIEINAKISLASHTEQNSNTKTVIEQFSANNIISDRQTQNLFRSLSLNKFHLQRNLNEVITNKLEKDLEQKPSITLSGESTETNLSFSSNETQNTKVEKNDLNLSPLKEQKINSEIKVNKGVNTDFSAQSNLETSEKIKNGKLNPALEVIKNSKTESNETETPDILSSQKERITSANKDVNYSKNHRDSSLLNNSFRVVNDKPAKGVSDINNNSIQEEKSISGNFNIVNEPSKEIKTTSEKENILFSETSQIDKKANLYSQQEQDNSKNSNQQYNQTLSKENPSLNTQAEHPNDFRDVVNGFEKKVTPLSSRTTNNINLNSNKFDFNKFFESKSLENFVRTLNDNNLNYRAELNNLAKSNNSVELRLYPEELGRVKIIIDNADNIVSARIEVQSEQAKNIILSNLPQLRESLKQEGLNTQNLNVYLGSDEQKGQNGANQKRKNNNKMSYDNQAQPEEVKIKNLGYNTIEYLA